MFSGVDRSNRPAILFAPVDQSIQDFSDQIGDFADLAALIENMDEVITIDSGPAHLAGAMGKPTRVLLRFPADWRWLLDRCDSPWYPSVKLYRQTPAGDWEGVISQVLGDLVRSIGKD
jgi:ADP-heptose:LPS heptosyltransferase